ncbi:hypothetical protein CBR_g57050 [Chara braunii]|uniref:Reverse transcriptase domain-containing protein n=1 Tax=Chara braunii TaxID=69332 RepID=A0A388K7Z4_CHABU|nr:hypothetical protein CBR_g57050 [Chara braunii]|eukprot:GBG66168.1 hypothetical protein CBR_g57050 [Chara braunii]
MEVVLNALRAAPLVKGLQLREGVEVLTGAIADDLLLITEATDESLRETKAVLDKYESLSEAKVNWDKSMYFLPAEFELTDDWTMKRIKEEESERYLGVQVSLTNSKPTQDAILASRVEARVKKCRGAAGLSLLGRAAIINTSILPLMWHIAAVILISRATLQKIMSWAAHYLWKPSGEDQGGFVTKVSWSKVTQPKKDGGLGVLDPEKQNLALLGKWLQKACNQAEKRSWLEIMQYILQQEFGLSRKEDVWVCLQISSFQNRRPRSAIGLAWWIAWRKLKKPNVREPVTRDEVLVQPLFENQAIKQRSGDTFPASNQKGAFGRKWVEKGVSQVRDIWAVERLDWKSETEVRQRLGRLREVRAKLGSLIQAIPVEWINLLKSDNRPKTGAWYKEYGEGVHNQKFYQIEDQIEDQAATGTGSDAEEVDNDSWPATEWQLQGPPGKQMMRKRGKVFLPTDRTLIPVRVTYEEGGNGHSTPTLVLGGAPITDLRIDPVTFVCLICSVIIHGVTRAVSRSIADYGASDGFRSYSSFSYADQSLARLPVHYVKFSRSRSRSASPLSSSSSSSSPKILMVSASQARCGTDDGDSDIVKFLKNKADYARKHDIATWFSLELLVSPIHGRSRNKVMLLRHLMRTQKTYDWFFWLDSDTMITDLNFQVPWLDYENHGYSMVVWGDPEILDRSPNYDQLNFGVLLLRNDRYALQFLDAIVDYWDSHPNYTMLYEDVRKTVSSMPPYLSDQSTAIYLLSTQKATWQPRVFLENRFHINRYWMSSANELEKYYEREEAWVGDGRDPPFILHFCGCALCYKKLASDFEECQRQHDRAFRFANNQVIKELGYQHRNLSSDEMVRLDGGKGKLAGRLKGGWKVEGGGGGREEGYEEGRGRGRGIVSRRR